MHGSLEVAAGLRPVKAAKESHVDRLRASGLLQNLASFYRGWERILGTMTGGYTASGNPAPVARAGRLCCQV